MKQKLNMCLMGLLLVFPILLVAQNPVEIIREKDNRSNAYIFYAVNKTLASQVVKVEFTSLQNYRVSGGAPYIYNAPPGKTRIFQLQLINEKTSGTFNYTYKSIQGYYRPKLAKNIIYQLPFPEGKIVKAELLTYLGEQFKKEKPKDWYSLAFFSNYGDTICAARGGTVIRVVQNKSENKLDSYHFKRDNNYIIIEHKDHTLGMYQVLKENSIMVNVGDKVIAGNPIALAGGQDLDSGGQVRFMVYYYDKEYYEKMGTNITDISTNIFVKPKFTTAEGQHYIESGNHYEAKHDLSVITQEMNKRQRKKFLKSK